MDNNKESGWARRRAKDMPPLHETYSGEQHV